MKVREVGFVLFSCCEMLTRTNKHTNSKKKVKKKMNKKKTEVMSEKREKKFIFFALPQTDLRDARV